MTFNDAFAADLSFSSTREVSISGHLVVCDLFAYLGEFEHVRFTEPLGRTILVADAGLSSSLSRAGCPVAIGSMVMFTGPATIRGKIIKTGLGVFPIAFIGGYELTFADADGIEYILRK